MTISTIYLLNVALHGSILSVVASLILSVLRQSRYRSIAAIAGLLAIGFLPWFTSMHLAQRSPEPIPEIQTQDTPAVPTWTVVTFSAQQKSTPVPAVFTAVPEKLTISDPLALFTTFWAVGTSIGLFLLGVAVLKSRSWRKSLRPLDDTTWQTLRNLLPEIPSRSLFWFSESTTSPCVAGFWQPRIILPRFLITSGSEEGLRWAVRHEIAHWRAGDSRWMLIFVLIRCTNWWNPIVHRLVSNWSDAREQICDIHATGAAGNRADYGDFLILMARKITSRLPLSIAMAERAHASRLKRRIVSLLNAPTDSLKPVGKSFIGINSAIFIICAALVSVVRIGAEEPENVIETAAETGFTGKQNDHVPVAPATPEVPAATPSVDVVPATTSGSVVQVKLTSKFVVTTTKPDFEDGAKFSDDQLQSIMRALSQNPGCRFITLPSVTSLFGRFNSLEMVEEVPERHGAVHKEARAPFVGIIYNYLPTLIDDQVELKFEVDYRFVPEMEPALQIDPEKIKSTKRVIVAQLTAGQTVFSDLGEIEPGRFLQFFTTAEPKDATAVTLDSFKNGKQLPQNPIVEPSAIKQVPDFNVPGKLRLEAVRIDLPLKSKRPPGEELKYGLALSNQKTAAKIRRTVGAQIRKLPSVEIPLTEPSTPWPDFPGLKVSAIASRDLKLISLSSFSVGKGIGELPNTWELLQSGSTMIFGIKTQDPLIERCLLITINAVK